MPNDNRMALSKARLEKAYECLRDAQGLLSGESLNGAVNRSYYSIFHAMRAVLALTCYDSKKHSGIISEFRRLFIKTGVFPKEFSRIVENAFTARGNSDYEDFFIISKEEVSDQIKDTKAFLEAVEAYICGTFSE